MGSVNLEALGDAVDMDDRLFVLKRRRHELARRLTGEAPQLSIRRHGGATHPMPQGSPAAHSHLPLEPVLAVRASGREPEQARSRARPATPR